MQGKNEVTRNLSVCIDEKFNGYETIRNYLTRKERIDFQPIDIVYEPCFDETTPVICNFTPKIFTVYKSYVGRFERAKENIRKKIVRQCHYCQNYFAKNEESMQKYLSICAAKEGKTFFWQFSNNRLRRQF